MFVIVAVVVYLGTVSAQDLWWKHANIYQIYPRSFKDSDGNGVGDLKGIEQKVSYFKEIGVTTIWLSPIQTSPMKDFGYDISDFNGIDPLFGTMDDFKSLAKTLSNLGIKLVLDFVPNHTSDQHPWFIKSVNREDPYTDYYVWSDGTKDPDTGNFTPPNNWLDVWSEPAWKWHETRQQFYLHQFIKEQPDLNFRNPNVTKEMEKVIRFWLDMGVDGFRIDSAKHIFEVQNISMNEPQYPGTTGTKYADYDHIYTTNQPETFTLLTSWGEIFYQYSSGGKPRVLLLEVYNDLKTIMEYYGSGNTSLMMPFNFDLLGGDTKSTRASGFKKLIDEWMNAMPKGDVANWVVGNHDQMRVATLCGPEMVDSINILTGVLPGIKITYNGEEIGMQNTFIRWDQTVDPSGLILGPDHYLDATRDPQRTPLQWDDSLSAGFSTNSTTWLPVNPNYWWLNIEAQKAAEHSHLKVFQAVSKIRMDPVMQKGDLLTLAPDNNTFIIIRSDNKSSYVLVINVGSLDTNYTSENLFAPQNLDMDMEVVLKSVNYANIKVGDVLKRNSIRLSMRPKSAVLLRSPPSSPSSTSSLEPRWLTLSLLFVTVLVGFWR